MFYLLSTAMRFPIRHKVLGKIIWTYDVGIYLSHYCMPFLSNLQICSLVTLLTLNFFFLERVSTYGIHFWWWLFIIRPKHQSVFGVGRNWTSNLLTLNFCLCFQILSFFGYTVATFMFYSLVPFVLKVILIPIKIWRNYFH